MNNVSPNNTAIKYGALNGLSAFAFFLILWATGKNPLGSWSILGWAIPVVFTIYAIRDHRDKDLGGYITYRRGLATGMLVSILSGFLVAVLIYAFIIFCDHTIPQMQIDDFYANMEKIKGFIGTETYESMIQTFEASKDNYTPGNMSISDFELHIFGGLVISLIIAAIYKKKPSHSSGTSDLAEFNPN